MRTTEEQIYSYCKNTDTKLVKIEIYPFESEWNKCKR